MDKKQHSLVELIYWHMRNSRKHDAEVLLKQALEKEYNSGWGDSVLENGYTSLERITKHADKFHRALVAIRDCKQDDLVKYVAKVDAIACEALMER